jgi:hypothetical protein
MRFQGASLVRLAQRQAGNLSHTLHCYSMRAHTAQVAVAVPMKARLFWGRPSLPPEQVIDGAGRPLCLADRAGPAVFFSGEGRFRHNIMPSAGHSQDNCFLRTGSFCLRTGTFWSFGSPADAVMLSS